MEIGKSKILAEIVIATINSNVIVLNSLESRTITKKQIIKAIISQAFMIGTSTVPNAVLKSLFKI